MSDSHKTFDDDRPLPAWDDGSDLSATATVIRSGLGVLGVTPVEEMR